MTIITDIPPPLGKFDIDSCSELPFIHKCLLFKIKTSVNIKK